MRWRQPPEPPEAIAPATRGRIPLPLHLGKDRATRGRYHHSSETGRSSSGRPGKHATDCKECCKMLRGTITALQRRAREPGQLPLPDDLGVRLNETHQLARVVFVAPEHAGA